jgi:hypothetical protein
LENEDEVIRQLSPVPGPSKYKRGRIELLTPRLSVTLDRCKISYRDAVHLLTACVEALSLDSNIYIINRTSIKKSREAYRQKISKKY